MELPTVSPHAPAHPPGPTHEPGRRTFLEYLSYALGAVAALLVGVPFVGYIVGRQRKPEKWVNLGAMDQFPQGQTRLVNFDNPIRQPWDGITAQTGVYVRYLGKETKKDEAGKETTTDQFLVLAINCAHLGCPVSWFPEAGLFMCPCHGGVYYADGERASGPPPRRLFHCVWRLNDRKELEVQAPRYPSLQDPLDPKDEPKDETARGPAAPGAGCGGRA